MLGSVENQEEVSQCVVPCRSLPLHADNITIHAPTDMQLNRRAFTYVIASALQDRPGMYDEKLTEYASHGPSVTPKTRMISPRDLVGCQQQARIVRQKIPPKDQLPALGTL